ncbi:hypothetical protein [Vibrio crassostreae]|uniref:hypothetical protein n=1 Tax=Vibrio crassostreae TaxID=246167 RepID=UPI00105249CC|nr:hypothetical protein [Vibrio crassostreae]TCW20764.1 hypothetical protein EDB48_103103 [Vibrio crassostreae]
MKTIQRRTVALLIGLSGLLSGGIVQASSCKGSECIYLSGSAGVAVGKENEKRDNTFRVGGGYQWGEHFAFGVNSVFVSNQGGEENSFGLDGVLRGFMPIGDKARLYGDAGVMSFGEDYLTLGGGILYRVISQFELDIGYRYYGELSSEQGDVYGVTAGLQYHFASPQKPTANTTQLRPSHVPTLPKSKPIVLPISHLANQSVERPKVAKSVALDCSVSRISSEQFTQNLKQNTYVYKIKKGDWAAKIARSHCTTLTVLMGLNPWLIERTKNEQYIYPQETLIVPKLL